MRFISLFSFTIVFTVNFAASAPDLNSFNSSQIPSKKSLGIDVNKPIQKEHIDYKSRVIKEKYRSLNIEKNVKRQTDPEIRKDRIANVTIIFNEAYQRYTGRLQLGFPHEENLRFSIETRSSLFWVSGKKCFSCLFTRKYDSLTGRKVAVGYSIDGKAIPKRFKMQRGTQLIEGVLYNDDLKIHKLFVRDFEFGVVEYLEGYGDTGWDGMLGLSITATEDWGPGLLFGLYEKGVIEHLMFGLFLSRERKSELILGGYNTTKVRWKDLSWNEVNEPPHWIIPLEAVFVNGRNAEIQTMRAEIDTSSRYIYAPYDDYEKFYKTFLYEGDLYKCHRPPKVSFMLNQVKYRIADFQRPGSLIVKGSYCYGVVVSYGHPPGTWILGTPFLENVYAVFDVVNAKIGFYSIFRKEKKVFTFGGKNRI